MLQHASIVIQAEQQRPDDVVSALVPTEAGNDAVRSASMLHLDQHALARLIRNLRRLRNHAIQAGALEVLEPLRGDTAISRHRRDVNGRLNVAETLLEQSSALVLCRGHHAAAIDREHVERDERCRRFLRQLGNTRCRRMQPHLQRVEIQSGRRRDDDLTVDHTADRQLVQQQIVQLRKISIERPQVAALNEHIEAPRNTSARKPSHFGSNRNAGRSG